MVSDSEVSSGTSPVEKKDFALGPFASSRPLVTMSYSVSLAGFERMSLFAINNHQ